MDEVILQSIFKVFQIEGRGTIVTGPIGAGWGLAKRGDKIELRTPDGRRIKTAIKDMEIFAEGKLSRSVLLADTFASDQLPRDTEMLRITDDSIA
jgi:translation elongation factor EF-Tu-like GTPase